MLQLIPIDPLFSDSCPGYIMIELQGELCSSSDATAVQQAIGVLCRQQSGADTLELTVGHHQLFGKLVDLKKPLLVLQKAPDAPSKYKVPPEKLTLHSCCWDTVS